MRRKLRKKSNATKLAHKKFRWLEQLSADPNISLPSLRACIQVCAHASLDHGGSAIVGQDTIAAVQRETVNRALRLAVALGHVEVIRRGRDHANAYRMVLKDEAQAADDVGKNPTSKAPHDVTREVTSSPHMMCVLRSDDVTREVTDSPFFSPGPLTEAPGGERETNACAFDNSLPAGTPPLTRDPAEEEATSPSGVLPLGPESPIERSRSVERAARERFAEL